MLIAITGGIGVGKSTIINELQLMGAVTIKSDEINRELLSTPSYIEIIDKEFPNIVQNNKVSTLKLKKLIFEDELMRKKLNKIAHPRILKRVLDESKKHTLLFVEIPLLYESQSVSYFDEIWLIKASLENRLKRILNRDKLNLKFAQKIIKAQALEEEKQVLNNIDLVITNDNDISTLKKTLEENYNRLRKYNEDNFTL